jgi:hypothetical protein
MRGLVTEKAIVQLYPKSKDCIKRGEGKPLNPDIPETFPVKLREAIEGYLSKWENSKLLTTKIFEHTPFIDKSVVVITYKAYLEWGNLLTVLSFDKESKDLLTSFGVSESSMIVGDINVFLENSRWFKQ